jgi:tetratricopeptide (TPR) repeat protein
VGYGQVEEGTESGAFQTRRPRLGVVRDRTNPASLARRHLERYGWFGPVDWRDRDEFAGLDPARRDELEVWLLEQALRYSRALASRSHAREDWVRALACLERARPSASSPLAAEAQALRARLGLPDAGPDAPHPTPPWMDDYLRGVSAELRGDAEGTREALDRYESVLIARPSSFWTNYRAAAAAFALADQARPESVGKRTLTLAPEALLLFETAAERLAACVAQRPGNAALRRQRAGCLYPLGRFEEAAAECDRAIALDPDHAETYFSRVFLRLELRQIEGFLRDYERYQELSGLRPSAPPALALNGLDDAPPPALREPGEAVLHQGLGQALARAGEPDLAAAEFDSALELAPDDPGTLWRRAGVRRAQRRPGSDDDYVRIATLARSDDWTERVLNELYAYHRAVFVRVREGRPEEAIEIAERGLVVARRLRLNPSESYYSLALASASGAATDHGLARPAFEYLRRSYAVDPTPERVQNWYLFEPAFSAIREEFGLALYQPD